MSNTTETRNAYDPIDITGIDHAELLAALYNEATPRGMGSLQAKSEPMTKEQAAEYIGEYGAHFDYVHGRSLKVSFRDGLLHRPDLYDRDQGRGRCARIVARLKGSNGNG